MRPRASFAAGISFALAGAVCSVALAQEAPLPPTSPRVTPWQAEMGYRGSWLPSAAYGPFSTNDYLAQFSLGGSRVLFVRGRLALAVGADWDYASPGASTRGSDTGLTVHRLTAPITLRYRLLRPLNAFVTVAPGAAHESAHLNDASAPAPLKAQGWVPAGDASAGVAWAFADSPINGHPLVWWLTAEGGYGWTGSLQLAMTPDLGNGNATPIGATNLGSLALSGGFGRIAIALSF
jgi:hypothetical protein